MGPVLGFEGHGVAVAVKQQGGTTHVGAFGCPLSDQGGSAGLGFVDRDVHPDLFQELGDVATHVDLATSVLWTKVLRVDLNHARADVDHLGLRTVRPVDKVFERHAEEI